jgi:hypothetical protein
MNHTIIFLAFFYSSSLIASEPSSKQKNEHSTIQDHLLPNKQEDFSIIAVLKRSLLKTAPSENDLEVRATHLFQFLKSAQPSTSEPTPIAKQQRPELSSKL